MAISNGKTTSSLYYNGPLTIVHTLCNQHNARFLKWAMAQSMIRGSLKNSLICSWETVFFATGFELENTVLPCER